MLEKTDNEAPHHDGGDSLPDNRSKYIDILKGILPYIQTDEAKVILAQVMIALKVEGVIGEELTPQSKKMVTIISRSIMDQPRKKKEALLFARKLLSS